VSQPAQWWAIRHNGQTLYFDIHDGPDVPAFAPRAKNVWNIALEATGACRLSSKTSVQPVDQPPKNLIQCKTALGCRIYFEGFKRS